MKDSCANFSKSKDNLLQKVQKKLKNTAKTILQNQ